MKYIAISGSWRKTSEKLEKDVRDAVREIITKGDGIIAGGALNVDFIATDEALKLDPTAKKIKIFLPITLRIFAKHYRKRAKEGVITGEQAEALVAQLKRIQEVNPSSLNENKNNTVVNTETYYERNSDIVNAADGLMAFHVNKTLGTQDAIDKARKRGIPVKVSTYTIG
ncbi:MAG: hypothetical protein PHF44_02385 [Candidatus Pacebacteria bacterium]|nr:hypothetical protein [Candidatus Paceibacterota bacterium]